MGREADPPSGEEMLDEYDFSHGVRGKYAARYAEGSNVVVLAPDVAEIFPDAESVNEALRALAKVARRQPGRRRAGRARSRSLCSPRSHRLTAQADRRAPAHA